MANTPPSPNGENGRDSSGRFTRGNPGGPGNPYARRVSDFRRVLLQAVTDDDLYDLARTLVEKGKSGDVMAVREVFDRLMGKSKATLALETEPAPTAQEAQVQLKALLDGNPRLVKQLTNLMGVKIISQIGATETLPEPTSVQGSSDGISLVTHNEKLCDCD